jgi:hypothetical protein
MPFGFHGLPNHWKDQLSPCVCPLDAPRVVRRSAIRPFRGRPMASFTTPPAGPPLGRKKDARAGSRPHMESSASARALQCHCALERSLCLLACLTWWRSRSWSAAQAAAISVEDLFQHGSLGLTTHHLSCMTTASPFHAGRSVAPLVGLIKMLSALSSPSNARRMPMYICPTTYEVWT